MRIFSPETLVFFEKLRESISNRDLQAAADFLKTPTPIFHPDGFKLVADRDDSFFLIKALFSGMDAIGAQKMFHSIDEVSKQPISSKLSCLLTFYYMDAHERHLCDSNLRFYLDRDINGLKIAMVEYQKVAFREMFENQPSVGAFEF